jgi:hypothetical protein
LGVPEELSQKSGQDVMLTYMIPVPLHGVLPSNRGTFIFISFDVPTAVAMKITTFWAVTQYSLAEGDFIMDYTVSYPRRQYSSTLPSLF